MFTTPRSIRHLGTLLLALAACDVREPGPWHEESMHRWRTLAGARGAGEGFHPVDPSESGIGFVNTVRDSVLHANRTLGNGSGVAIGDVDGDGHPDNLSGTGPNTVR